MKTSLTIALTMALLLNLDAQARPAAHSGIAPSFRGGFTSQKSTGAIRMAPRPPAAAPAQSPSRYGTFGKAADSDAARPPSSAMSRDLAQKAASENALRTLDARRAAAAPVAPPAPAPAPTMGPMPAPPVVVQQRSGMGDILLGFMLARATAGSHAAPATVPATTSAPSEHGAAPSSGSFGAGVLRAVLWLAVLGAAGWAVYAVLRRLQRARLARTPNYTFEGQ